MIWFSRRFEGRAFGPTRIVPLLLALSVIFGGLGVAGATSSPGLRAPDGPAPSAVATRPASCTPYSGQTLDAAGSTFVAPLIDQWEASYDTNVVDYDAVGSSTGISDLGTLAVALAASDAPVSYSQILEYSNLRNNTFLTMPESAGGAAIIYNLAGSWHDPLNLTAAVLASIFQGTITTWDAPAIQTLNPADSLPSTPIIVVHRTDGSGTSYMFQQFLQWDSGGAWDLNYSTSWLGPLAIPGEIGARGSSGVTSAVKADVGAISYVDVEYAVANGISGMAAVQNVQGNFVVPSVADTLSAIVDKVSEPGFSLPAGDGNWSGVNLLNAPGADDYPITSFTYLMFYEHPDVAFGDSVVMTEAIADGLANFLNWSVSATGGQQYSDALYYDPLPAMITSWDDTTIGMMTWGGVPVPLCQPEPLSGVSLSPGSGSVALEGTVAFTATPVCGGGPSCLGISYAWSLNNTLGTLSSASGASTEFVAGDSPGLVEVQVEALQGVLTALATASVQILSGTVATLTSVSVSPASALLATNGTQALSAAPVCSGTGGCPAGTSYTWSLSPDLGQLSTLTGSSTTFTAGGTGGGETVSLSAVLNSVTRTATASLSISQLQSATISPASGSLSVGSSLALTANAVCSTSTCPAGLAYAWSVAVLSGSSGTLNNLTGSQVSFTAGGGTGQVRVSVSVSLGGRTVLGSSVLNITQPPGKSSASPSFLGTSTGLFLTVGLVVVLVVVIAAFAFRRRRSPRGSLASAAPSSTASPLPMEDLEDETGLPPSPPPPPPP